MSKDICDRVSVQIEAFRNAPQLVFFESLQAEQLVRLMQEEAVTFRDRVFNPAVTLAVFLSQVLSTDQSCRQAVARLNAFRSARGENPTSPDTGSYCKARARLPETVLAKLVRQTGRALDEQAPASWLWHGRRVILVDGTTVSMPDTPANQTEYPQMRSQLPGVGFPIARVVALLSLASGAALDVAVGPYQGKASGEPALLRRLFDTLRPGDIVLADRYFASYFTMVLLQQRGVDVVIRAHHLRKVDFRRGQRLGPYDHLVTWRKPQRPYWMDQETYDRLPDRIIMRELRNEVSDPTVRVDQVTLVTTLTDPVVYTKQALGGLYPQRWNVELDLRSIKAVLQMDVLRGKTPAMVRKEIGTHLLGYNLIRTLMADAAKTRGITPRRISFKGALQTLAAYRDALLLAQLEDLDRLVGDLLAAIARHRVGDRPGRIEPRAVKRRPKPHHLLNKPRPEARNQYQQNRLG